eukprot:4182760-Heterocapsa_arctica.AAC.1
MNNNHGQDNWKDGDKKSHSGKNNWSQRKHLQVDYENENKVIQNLEPFRPSSPWWSTAGGR